MKNAPYDMIYIKITWYVICQFGRFIHKICRASEVNKSQ